MRSLSPSRPPAYASASRGPVVGRTLANGKLLIEECVGQGGIGTVYRASHRNLRMPLAVKLMHEQYEKDPDFCARFRAEALSASRLDHPNLTRVLDYGQEPDGLLYIAMELLSGRSLRDVLDIERHLTLERASKFMFQICAALTHAHARGVVHRDIKPENIVIVPSQDDDGNPIEVVKVCDFGIAHTVGNGPATIFAGTAEYMSPELLAGATADATSDVYACGVLFYELLTGQVPIQGEQPEIAERVRTVIPEPPSKLIPGLDVRIDGVVRKALAKHPSQRHASARELRIELRAALEVSSELRTDGQWSEVDPPSARLRAMPLIANAPPFLRSSTPPTNAATQVPAPPASQKPTPPAPAPAEENDWIERGGLMEASIAAAGNASPSSTRPALSAPPILGSTMSSTMSSTPPITLSVVPPTTPAPVSGVRAAVRSSQPTPSQHAMDAVHLPTPPPPPPPSTKKDGPVDEMRLMAVYLRQLVETTDAAQLGAALQSLGQQVRTMLEQGQADPLWRICSTLEMIATEPPHDPGSRASQAKAFLDMLFSDRQLLGPLAHKALHDPNPKDISVRKLIVRASNTGAQAIYSARVKDLEASSETRERFITILRELGPVATPTIRDALGLLETRLHVPGAVSVAEDLLRAASAASADEALAAVVRRYAESAMPTLSYLAAGTLSKVSKA